VATERFPLVSIGVPVYNGERYLRASLDALLAQTFTDIELIVSDNASTDATWDICTEATLRDPRVRTFRQERNLGAPANWNFTARRAHGRFFKWASASDLCAPSMIERCLEAMQDESVVLAFGRTCLIEDDGRELGVFDRDFAVEDERPHERFRRVCHELSINNAQSGLIRMDALRRTRLDRLYPSGDLVLMAELAMQGKWRLIDEVLLYRRAGAQHFTAMRTSSELNEMFRPGAASELPFLNLRRHADFIGSALASPAAPGERLRAAMAALKGLYWDRRGVREDISRMLNRVRT
jgi:glycosyltransferase involved in cell wall biosynthesis